jgi:hypothetical protein
MTMRDPSEELEDRPKTVGDLIEKLKRRPKTVEEQRSKQKSEWLQALDDLFTTIEGWLDPAARAGVLSLTRYKRAIIEQDLGDYEAPVLQISDSELTVRLEPAGARVVGVVAAGGRRYVGLRGRVDLVCGPIRIPIVRDSLGNWKALPLRGEPRELNEESFVEMLGEVLLDE